MQVVSQYSALLAPLAVDAVLNVRDLDRPDSVDLRDIKVLRKLGGTVSASRLIVACMVFAFRIARLVYCLSGSTCACLACSFYSVSILIWSC